MVLIIVKKNLLGIMLTIELPWVSASFNPHLHRNTKVGRLRIITSQHPCRRPDRRWRLAETHQHQDTLGIGAQLSLVILTAGSSWSVKRCGTPSIRVCSPGQNRRHDLAWDTGRTPATHPLHRPRAGPSRTHSDGCGAERAAARRVVAGDRACQHPHHAVRAAHGGCRRSVIR
jgi:hypothetical protein